MLSFEMVVKKQITIPKQIGRVLCCNCMNIIFANSYFYDIACTVRGVLHFHCFHVKEELGSTQMAFVCADDDV